MGCAYFSRGPSCGSLINSFRRRVTLCCRQEQSQSRSSRCTHEPTEDQPSESGKLLGTTAAAAAGGCARDHGGVCTRENETLTE